MVGYLGVMESLLSVSPNLGRDRLDLAQYLFDKCLFE